MPQPTARPGVVSETADDRFRAVGPAMPGVRFGEGLDHHGAVMAGGVQDAVGAQHEAGMAVPRTFAGRQPDNEVAALSSETATPAPSSAC
jgi:hypothetical protein